MKLILSLHCLGWQDEPRDSRTDINIEKKLDVPNLYCCPKQSLISYMQSRAHETFVATIWHHLKRQCHEIFCHFFVHESNPFGSLTNNLKWFHWNIRFREYIRKKRDSVQCDTAPSQEIEMSENPKLSNTVQSWTLRSEILRQVYLRAVWYCAESNSLQC